MPSDKPPTVSFNQWLSMQHDGPFASVAKAWRTSRGRLTRATVVARSMTAGVPGALAGEAYDAYLSATGQADLPSLKTS